MWGWRQRKTIDETSPDEPPQRLREALRKARVDQAERVGTVVDLQDAELARLELLNEALDPLFDAVTHVDMGRDKRVYRFLQDTRHGRKVLAETGNAVEAVDAVTRYVAQRMVERERALADSSFLLGGGARRAVHLQGRRARWRVLGAFLLGIFVGCAALIAAALLLGPKD